MPKKKTKKKPTKKRTKKAKAKIVDDVDKEYPVLDASKIKKTAKGKDIITVTKSELAPFFQRVGGGSQNVYICPFCKARGHTGGNDKLYFDEIKKIGYCHVCQLILVYEESYDLPTEMEGFIKNNSKEKELPEEEYDVTSWTKLASDSPEVLKYIKENRKIEYGKVTLDKHNVRFGILDTPNGPAPLMIFPNTMKPDGQGEEITTNFFQYKCLDMSVPLPKYMTAGSAPIVWLEKSIEKKEIILVEGIFDAMAVDGCAMTGKVLSKKQQQQLGEFCLHHQAEIESVTLAPDNDLTDKEVKRLIKVVKGRIGDIPLFLAKMPPDLKDPEEVVAAGRFREIFVDQLEAIK